MHWQPTPMIWLYGLAVVVAIWVSWRAWSMRHVRGAAYFALTTAGGAVWTAGYMAGFFSTEPAWKLAMLRVEYLGIVATPLCWLFFAATYSRSGRWLDRRTIGLLSVVPAVTYLQVLFVEAHGLFYHSFTVAMHDGLVVSVKDYGPGFYIWLGYCYFLTLSGVLFLLRAAFHRASVLRPQVMSLSAVVVLVLLTNVLYITGNNPLAPYDPTSLSFVAVGVLLLFSMRSYRLLDLAPVAHDLVFENARVGVVVVDERGRVLELNPAAEALTGSDQSAVVGEEISALMPSYGERILRESRFTAEVALESGRVVELQSAPILTPDGKPDGRVVMLYDVTDRKLAEDELRRQATTDPLTGVLNRRHFFLLAEQALKQSRREIEPVAVAMIDLDHFKRINDRFGHSRGDEVLKLTAGVLRRGIRDVDVLARFGGEEFVILMPRTPAERAVEVAERLRLALVEESLDSTAGEPVSVTISVGIALLDPGQNRAIERALDRADRALYRAKAAGRNRVEVEVPSQAGSVT